MCGNKDCIVCKYDEDDSSECREVRIGTILLVVGVVVLFIATQSK